MNDSIMSEYVDGNGLHLHKCDNPECRKVWQHPECGGCVEDDRKCFQEVHKCPNCGSEQSWKYPLAKVSHIDYPWKGENNEHR